MNLMLNLIAVITVTTLTAHAQAQGEPQILGFSQKASGAIVQVTDTQGFTSFARCKLPDLSNDATLAQVSALVKNLINENACGQSAKIFMSNQQDAQRFHQLFHHNLTQEAQTYTQSYVAIDGRVAQHISAAVALLPLAIKFTLFSMQKMDPATTLNKGMKNINRGATVWMVGLAAIFGGAELYVRQTRQAKEAAIENIWTEAVRQTSGGGRTDSELTALSENPDGLLKMLYESLARTASDFGAT